MDTWTTIFVLFAVVLAASVVSYELRRSRNRRLSRDILSDSACPECNQTVGPDAAHAGIASFRLDKHISIGNFGLCAVNCRHCTHQFYYHINDCRIVLPPYQWEADPDAP